MLMCNLFLNDGTVQMLDVVPVFQRSLLYPYWRRSDYPATQQPLPILIVC